MKSILPLAFLAFTVVSASAENVSQQRVQSAIDQGLTWLKSHQLPDGSFGLPENPVPPASHPALSAFTLTAFHAEPTGKYKNAGSNTPEVMKKGYAFVRSKVQSDGGIYVQGLSNYNTSICLISLLNSGDPADEPIITRARAFVVGQQAKGMASPSLDGGFGYGPTGTNPKRGHPDLDNTLMAIEAFHAYQQARPAVEIPAGQDLNWQAAIDFVTRGQNLPSHNKEAWASGDAANQGGFVYYPGFSNAGEMDLPDGKKALRSYASMTYAGLLSFVHAELQRDDPRVRASVDWLSKNYTLEENPGMGRAGLYFYYHLMSKTLPAAGLTELPTADGRKVSWAPELAARLLSLQAPDGSWVNDTGRWMEKDPILVTTYCLLALENLARVLPQP